MNTSMDGIRGMVGHRSSMSNIHTKKKKLTQQSSFKFSDHIVVHKKRVKSKKEGISGVQYRSDCVNQSSLKGFLYFEIRIKRMDDRAVIAVGMSFDKFPLGNQLTGWLPKSWGYHSDDGCYFYANSREHGKFNKMFGMGDVVGCGCVLLNHEYRIFWTLNGKFIGFSNDCVSVSETVFPTVSIEGIASFEFVFDRTKQLYDIKEEKNMSYWNIIPITNRKIPRCGHSGVLNPDAIWSFGGVEIRKPKRITRKNVVLYKFETGTWEISKLPKNIKSRFGHSCVYYENRKFNIIFGGRIKKRLKWKIFDDLYFYNIETGIWKQIPVINPPAGRFEHTASIIGDKMYCFGGNIGNKTSVNDFFSLDLGSLQTEFQHVQVKTTSPSPRFGHTANVYEEKIYIFGGFNGRDYFNDLHIFYPQKSQWVSPQVSGHIPFGRYRHSACIFDHYLVISGGQYEEQLLNDIWILNLTPNSENILEWHHVLNYLPMGLAFHSSHSFYTIFRDDEYSLLKSLPDEGFQGSVKNSIVVFGGTIKENSYFRLNTKLQMLFIDPHVLLSNNDPVIPFGQSLNLYESSGIELVTRDLKLCFEDDIRLVTVSETISVDELNDVVQGEFGTGLVMKFIDEDADVITITKQRDLETFFNQHQANRRTAKLLLSFPGNRTIMNSPGLGKRASEQFIDFSQFSWHIDINEIQLEEKSLGKGFFGEVKRGKWNGVTVACKILYRNSFKDKKEMDLFIKEVEILTHLRHPKIILFLGACLKGDIRLIVFEYMKNGSLRDAIDNMYIRSLKLTDPMHKFALISDIVQGMSHLHSRLILHRDLNSKNILLDDNFSAKIADFGLSKIIEKSVDYESSTHGALAWMAPEVLSNSKYTKAADIYSFGILTWEIVTFQKPETPEGMKLWQFAKHIAEGQYIFPIPDDTPLPFVELLNACLSFTPEERPTFMEISDMLPHIKESLINEHDHVSESDDIGIALSLSEVSGYGTNDSSFDIDDVIFSEES
eukprot:TRINITY_DN3845_c0_g1_i1.p1 TRINITY_DN3845_c0_g1~~TRINITY_DN3845_c0_g1_i1.p1  ORF type:complete len:998 (+),score=177.58 TRINITY_DN3845_c0_g1_i1:1-2994(+)